MNFNYLPAWRWTFTPFHTNYGIGFSMNAILTGLAQILFQIAAGIWLLLLLVVQFASTTNLVNAAAGKINGVVSALFGTIMGQGGSQQGFVLGALTIFVATYALVIGVRAGAHHAFRVGMAAAIPLAIFLVMGVASTHGPTAPLSPGGIATGLNGDVNSISNYIPTLVGQQIYTSNQAVNLPDCANYENGLEKEFSASAQNSPGSNNGFSAGTAANIPLSVNDLWLSGYLNLYSAAQFGTSDVGNRVACRWLEGSNNVSAASQMFTEGVGGSVPQGMQKGVFGPYIGDDMSTSLSAWATCVAAGGGTWAFYDDFGSVVGNGGAQTTSANQDCGNWWTTASADPPACTQRFGTACNGQTESQIATDTQNAPIAQQFFQGWNGNEGGTALINGFFALITAGCYLFALGGLALGTLLAQVILIVVLCALPLLLLAMAIPGETGKRVGREALKIGLGAAVAKIIFAFLLGLLLDTINILNTVFSGLLAGKGALLAGLVPLLAFYALHMLLKRMGLQGLTSVKGAVQTTAGISKAAGWDQSIARPMSTDRALSRRNGRPDLTGARGGRGDIDPTRPGGARPPVAGVRSARGVAGGTAWEPVEVPIKVSAVGDAAEGAVVGAAAGAAGAAVGGGKAGVVSTARSAAAEKGRRLLGLGAGAGAWAGAQLGRARTSVGRGRENVRRNRAALEVQTQERKTKRDMEGLAAATGPERWAGRDQTARGVRARLNAAATRRRRVWRTRRPGGGIGPRAARSPLPRPTATPVVPPFEPTRSPLERPINPVPPPPFEPPGSDGAAP